MNKITCILGLIILNLLLSFSFCEAGVSRIKIGNEFFENAFNLITKILIDEANKFRNNVPEINFNLKLANFIPFDTNIKNFTYNEIQYTENQFLIKHKTGDEISLKLSNLNLKGKTNLGYKLWFLKQKTDEVEFDLDVSAEVDLKIELTKDNFISFKFGSIIIDHKINKLDIKGDFILEVIAKSLGLYRKLINNSLEKVILEKLTTVQKNINENLQKNIEVPLLNATIGIKMANSILYSDEFFEIDLQLDLDEEGTKESPLGFLQNRLFTNDLIILEDAFFTDDVQISVDANLINKLLQFVLKNFRTITITNDLLPVDFPFKINTAYFQALIPEMYQKYPDKDLIIKLDIDSYPTISLNSTEEIINSELNIAISFAIKDDPDVQIFLVSTSNSLKIILDASKEDSTIHFQVKEVITNDIFVVASTIGDISAESIKTSINMFFSSFIYFVNNYLRLNPIAVPIIKGLKFDYIKISVVEDNLLKIRCQPDFNNTHFDWLMNNE